MKEIDALISLIAKHFPFHAEVYPELRDKDEKQHLVFALRHSALHFSKTAGKIATVSEDVDHGEGIDREEIRKQVPKALINTLRLAELVGLSGDDLIRMIEEKYQDKI